MRFAASAAALIAVATVAASSVPSYAAPPPAPAPAPALSASVPVPTSAPAGRSAPDSKAGPLIKVTSKQDCATVKAKPSAFRKAGRNQAACDVAAAAPSARAGLAPVSCKDLNPGGWTLTRTSTCLNGFRRGYQTLDATGAVTGTATMELSTEMTLVPNRLTWSERWYVTLVEGTGRLASMNFILRTTCGTNCTNQNVPAGAQAVTAGNTVSGTINYASNPAGRSQFSADYTLVPTNAGNDNLPTSSWSLGQLLRCDRMIQPAGCVSTWFGPNLTVAMAQTPEVFSAIWWAQGNLVTRWGAAGVPVRRMTDTVLGETSYTAICRDGTFLPRSEVPQDTCFDYPSRGNYENGYLQGVAAPQADCAEIRPGRDPATGAWTVYYTASSIDGTERCARAHIPAPAVTAFNQQLNAFFVANRILDQDIYGYRLQF